MTGLSEARADLERWLPRGRDANGEHPFGLLGHGPVSGEAGVLWNDGYFQAAP